jgi:hypothetical protein
VAKRVIREPARLLAKQNGRRTPDQYTSSTAHAIGDAGEAIPEDAQQEISDEARRKWSVLKAEELARKETRSRCNRLRQFEQRAQKKQIDVHRHIAAIEREIEAIRQLVDPA